MTSEKIREILSQFQAGQRSLEETMLLLKSLPFHDLGFAKIDQHRALRCGFPEVVFAQHKTPDEFLQITQQFIQNETPLLATRVPLEHHHYFQNKLHDPRLHYYPRAQVMTFSPKEIEKKGAILVVSAGTADIPVAEEASLTAQMMGGKVTCLFDVGVAGLHRLLAHVEQLQQANVIVVVAGMEGALASVVGGLVSCPVIAVPTSIGYGAHFQGLAPLLAMLNSCAAGVSVVNINNGFGAGYSAALINQKIVQNNSQECVS